MKFIVIIIIILNIILCLISNYNSKNTLIKDLNKLTPLYTFIKTNILKYKHFYIKKTINKVLL
jgi:Tfp pilus assembly major pilin PilA